MHKKVVLLPKDFVHKLRRHVSRFDFVFLLLRVGDLVVKLDASLMEKVVTIVSTKIDLKILDHLLAWSNYLDMRGHVLLWN